MLNQFDNLSKFNKFKAALIFLLIIVGLVASITTKPDLGLDTLSNQLKPCPKKPNCINTEYPDDTAHYVKPLFFPNAKANDILSYSKNIILSMDGEIVKEETNYIHAIFTSKVFKFVDDFEIRVDPQSQQLHIRSGSRLGYSDFDVNRKRVELFSNKFKQI